MTDALLTSHLDLDEDLLGLLAIPVEFVKYDDLDDVTLHILYTWKDAATQALKQLETRLLRGDAKVINDRPLEERVVIAAIATQFLFEDPWTNDRVREYATAILHALDVNASLVNEVLSTQVKPIFVGNPHPLLNTTSGRKLSRPAGGAAGSSQMYDHQDWKAHPEVVCTLRWCIRSCPAGAFENMWHLLVPPMMTLLDDYQMRWKISGLRVVSDLLDTVPPTLLSRTGLDGLLYKSLQTALSNVTDPNASSLIGPTIPTTLKLIQKTTSFGSEARMTRLYALLGDGIIGTIWTYGAPESAVVRTTYEILPSVLEMTGIGCARFLKAILPQLIQPLVPAPPGVDLPVGIAEARIPALRALQSVIHVCAVRMYRWKGTILEGVGKCWVDVVDREQEQKSKQEGGNRNGTGTGTGTTHKQDDQRNRNEELKTELRKTCGALEKACPSVRNDEFRQLVDLDPMFRDLVGPDLKSDPTTHDGDGDGAKANAEASTNHVDSDDDDEIHPE